MKFETFRFNEVTINFDRKRVPLSAKQRSERQGNYRYYGAQGIIDYVDDYIFDGTYLLIAEDGENLKSKKQNIAQIAKGKFWVNNHAHIIQTNERCDLRYLHYLINTMDLSGYITGSAQPKLSQTNLNAVTLQLPSINEQKKIVAILGSLDDKIELNNKINENLERQVQAMFESWFASFDITKGVIPNGWRQGTLGEIASITSGKRPPMKQSASTAEAKIPLVGASSIMGYTNAILYNEPILITGRVGTHGVVQRFQSPCWASDNTLVIKSKYYEYTYQVLQRVDYVNMNRGSTQPLITQTDLKNIPVVLPPRPVMLEFEGMAGTLMAKYQANCEENKSLSELRDILSPKLMSGEIDVEDVKI